MKQIFEGDTPPNVEVFESDDKISVKIRRAPHTESFGASSHFANPRRIVYKTAVDYEGVRKLKEIRSRPHRFVLYLTIIIILPATILFLYLYPDALGIFLIIGIVLGFYLYENGWKISDVLNKIQSNKNVKLFAQHGISEYNVFVDFDKHEKTVHPHLDKELFAPEDYDMSEFSHIETQPNINDCRPFPIDETATFVYNSGSSQGIRYRYGIRQSKSGFLLSATDVMFVHRRPGSDSDPNLLLTAVLNEIITLVRGDDAKGDHQPFNPMD